METPEKGALISGIGISRIGRRTGIPGLELTLEACRAALADAGMVPADVDGLASLGDTPPRELAHVLGIRAEYRGGGFETGGLLGPVMGAAVAVGEGRARHVLVYRTVQMMGGTVAAPSKEREKEAGTKSRKDPGKEAGRPDRPDPAANQVMADVPMLLAAGAASAANWIGMHATRHMHLYGTTREHLGAIALNARRNAALNPLAVYRESLTMADYLAARPVSSPFGLLDCDVPVDGSIAVVVSAPDFEGDLAQPAVRIDAAGGSSGAGSWTRRPDFPRMASSDAAAQMWSRTTLRPGDLDFGQIYDGFTFLTLGWLEALGVCGEGESGPFVEGGSRIALDGEFPINTYGGQLSAGRMHGYWVLHEAVTQLRGQAGVRQISGRPEVGVVTAGGGPIAGSILLTT